VVHPERGHAYLRLPAIQLRGFVSGSATLFIHDAQIMLSIVADEVAKEDELLPEFFRDVIGRFVPLLGYQLGYSYEFEVLTWFEDKGATIRHEVAGVQYPRDARPENPKPGDPPKPRMDWKIVIDALKHEYPQLLARAVRDINSAVRDAGDAAFHCYRAVESVKEYFQVTRFAGDEKKKCPAWQETWQTLKLDKSILGDMKEAADTVRHGGTVAPNLQAQEKWIAAASLVVQRFADFLATEVRAGRNAANQPQMSALPPSAP
jgi:hypothetical protein